MTESTVSAAPAKQPSFWEDLLDIYFAPADVFRRREHTSVWPPMLFVAIAIGVIVFVTFNTLEPVFEAEFIRGVTQQAARSGQPAPNPEMLQRVRGFAMAGSRYGIAPIMLVTMFVLGTVSWLVGKLVGSKQTYHAALVVAAWAYMPRVIGAVLGAVQGLVMDTSTMNSQMTLSIGPARFFDVDTQPLLVQILGRFDLITIWVTILLAVGLYVTGKVSKSKAALFGVLIWLVGSLPALRAGFLAS